jgi:rhamnopyranosyl-N-acetylglucosaminyl-diphospho-decaprenol beta-1,3/1,4-galactofuranosyltransferase
MEPSKVTAIIVTYNRCELLRRCLGALLAQTVRIEHIIVVDNASNDGTSDMLRDEFPLISHVAMEFNLGGAGGFYVGMKLALQSDAQWLWLMDDDGFPEPSSLEILISAAKKNNFDIVNPLVLQIDDEDKLSFALARLDSRAAIVQRFGDIVPGEINAFNGTLISRSAVEEIGLVKGEMFIWGDETEYVFRAKARGKQVGTVMAAIHRHPPVKKKYLIPLGGIFGKLIDTDPARSKIMYRNMGYNYHSYAGRLTFLGKCFVHLLFFISSGRWSYILPFLTYFADGALDLYRLEPSRAEFQRKSNKVIKGQVASESV